MSHIRSRDMAPEMLVRKLVYRLGYRYRLHRKDLAGKPDISFIGRKKVIFVHGCFWHQHADPNCKIARVPKSNQSYWIPKLARNQRRDAKNIIELANMGWEALVIWECELKDADSLIAKITTFLGPTSIK